MSEKIKKLILEKYCFGLQSTVSKTFLEDVKFESYYDIFYQQMVHRLCWWVWGRDVSQTVVATTSYPASWWEAFKDRFLPKFLQKRFPVERVYVDTIIHHFHVCPHINYKFENASQIHFTFLEGKEP